MDRKITRKYRKLKRGLAVGAVLLALGGAFFVLVNGSGARTAAVELRNYTQATAQRASFAETVVIDGVVKPRRSVQLDAVEGGRVEEKYAEAGATLFHGQPLLRLSNSALQLEVMNREEQLFAEQTSLKNARQEKTRSLLNYQEQLLELEHQLDQARRDYRQDSQLIKNNFIPKNDFEKSRETYHYLISKRELMGRKIAQETTMTNTQVAQFEAGVELRRKNLQIVSQNLDALTLRAPVAGKLSQFDAEVGQLVTKGQSLGQIDAADGFLIRASIDEYYLSRVARGQRAAVRLNDRDYELEIVKVDARVNNGQFEADLVFVADTAPELRRGQGLTLELRLGQNRPALVLPKGAFYRDTGGSWIFVLDPDKQRAVRRTIKLGRQNQDYYEVLEGLEEGETVLISSYDGIAELEALNFK